MHLYEADFDPRRLEAAHELAEELLCPDAACSNRSSPVSAASRSSPSAALEPPAGVGWSSSSLRRVRSGSASEAVEKNPACSGSTKRAAAADARARGAPSAAFGHLLQALDESLGPRRELAIVGGTHTERAELLAVVREELRPGLVLAAGPGPDERIGPLAGREVGGGGASAHLCERFVCQSPVTTPDELRLALGFTL